MTTYILTLLTVLPMLVLTLPGFVGAAIWLLLVSLCVQILCLLALTLRPIPPALAERLRRLRERTDAFGIVRALFIVSATRTASLWAGIILILCAYHLGPLMGHAHELTGWALAIATTLASFLHIYAVTVIVRAASPQRRYRLCWLGSAMVLSCLIIITLVKLQYLPGADFGFAPLQPITLTGLGMLAGSFFPSALSLTKPA